jgi:thiosulfate/3-mercaptopyruvate sulfurtransferase
MTATMRYAHPDAIVDTQWLADNLRDPSLRVFDCTTYLRYETGTGRPYRVESGRADYDKGHIPGSAFLDLQGELSDDSARFNFTMPALDDLAARFVAKGIGEGTRAVLYSRGSMQWVTRVWWMLRAVGFDHAGVLDGGFGKWSAEGRPTETAETRYPPATLVARPRFRGRRRGPVEARPGLLRGRHRGDAQLFPPPPARLPRRRRLRRNDVWAKDEALPVERG